MGKPFQQIESISIMKNMIEKINTKLFYFLALCIFIASCSKDDEVISPKQTPFNASVVSYFKEIALGFVFEIIPPRRTFSPMEM